MKQIFFFFIICLLISCYQSPKNEKSSSKNNSATPAGKTILKAKCSKCHSYTRVYDHTGTKKEWSNLIKMMKKKGAKINEKEIDALSEYLLKKDIDN